MQYLDKYNYTKQLYFVLFLFIMYVLIIFTSLRPIGLDKDIDGYIYLITNIGEYLNYIEPSFVFISQFSNFIFPNDNVLAYRMVFSIYASLNIFFLFLAINRYSKYPLISIFIYIALFYPTLTLTQIRFGVVASIFLLAISDIYERKLFSFYLKIFIAIFFHYSAIFMLPFYFLGNKKVNRNFYFLLFCSSFLFLLFTPLLQELILLNLELFPEYLSMKLYLYLDLKDYSDINILNSFSGICIFTYLLLLFNINKVENNLDHLFIKILGWGLFFYICLSFFPTLSVRILNFTSLVLMFLLINTIVIFKQKNLMLVGISILLILVAFKVNYINGLLNFNI